MGAFRGAMGGVGAARGPVLALIWTVALVGWPANLAGAAATRLNPIAAENQQPGSDGWNLGALVSDDVGNQVKGYASDSSVAPGGTLDFHVTVNPPQTFSIEFYRIGYYQGHGGRLMLATGPISGTSQPPCGIDSATGMVACDWTVAYSLQVPSTGWISGVFVAKLINADGYQNYVPFVLRDDRVADLRYQLAVTSYQAYNNYPNRSFGKSLYEYNSAGGSTVAGTPRAVKVSFDRPYANGGSGLLFEWEHAFIRWAESRSYDLTYVTDIDVHEAGGLLLSDRAAIDSGHDEYWSKEMFDAWQAARDAGVSLGFFGANEAYWQIRFEPDARGRPDRVMVCYKSSAIDPVQGPTTTVNFRSGPVNRPEQQLVGMMFDDLVGYGANVPYVVTGSNSWVYAGTGLADGDSIPGLVGYEMDRSFSEYPAPASLNGTYTILSHSPYVSIGGTSTYAESAVYQAPSAAWVFAAGTISWPGGLDSNVAGTTPDPRIQRITSNVLDRFVAGPGPASGPPSSPLLPQAAPALGQVDVSWSAPATDGGSPITRYTATVRPGDGTCSSPPPTTSCTIGGLTPGTVYTVSVTATNAFGDGPASVGVTFTTLTDGEFQPVDPIRVLDTRTGPGGGAPLGPGQIIDLVLRGPDGLPLTGATAATLNVTVTAPTSAGYLTIWPAGTPMPTTSNLNFQPGDTVANLVTVALGEGGVVSIFNYAGTTHVVADFEGYFVSGSAAAADRFHPVTPIRLLDTRADRTRLGGGGIRRLAVATVGGLPAGAEAAVLNVTVDRTTASGYLSVWPGGSPQKVVSSLNWRSGQVVANQVTVRLGGPGGEIVIFNFAGSADVIIDLAGWYAPRSVPGGLGYHPLRPARVLDTRGGEPGRVAPGAVVELDLAGPGRPLAGTHARAVNLNLTVDRAGAPGFLTLWPPDQARPVASNLNWVAGAASANLGTSGLSATGVAGIYSYGGPVAVIADLQGYYW